MRFKHIAFGVTIALAAPFLQANQARAATYDAFKQYSIKVNPSGPWSYRAAGQLLPLKHTKCNALKKDYCWTNNNDGYPTEAADEANKSGKTASYLDVILPANYLDFDPEQTADVELQNPVILPAPLARYAYGIQLTLVRPISIGIRQKDRLYFSFHDLLDHHLGHTICYSGHPQ